MRIKVYGKPFLLLSYTCPPLPCTCLLSQWDQIKINFQSGKINDKLQILAYRLFLLRFLQSFSKSTKSISIIYFAPLCKVTDQIHYVFRRHCRRGGGSNAQWFKMPKIGLKYDFTKFFKATFSLSISSKCMNCIFQIYQSHSMISRFDDQPFS